MFSSGVRLYVLKDFGTKVSFNSILWSHFFGSGNHAAFPQKIHPDIYEILLEFVLPRGDLFFLRLISLWILVEFVCLALIQVPKSVSPVPVMVAIISDRLFLSNGLWVEFRCSSSSFTSSMVMDVPFNVSGCFFLEASFFFFPSFQLSFLDREYNTQWSIGLAFKGLSFSISSIPRFLFPNRSKGSSLWATSIPK